GRRLRGALDAAGRRPLHQPGPVGEVHPAGVRRHRAAALRGHRGAPGPPDGAGRGPADRPGRPAVRARHQQPDDLPAAGSILTPALRPLIGGSQDRVLVGRLVRACSAETLRRRFFLPGEPAAEVVLARYGRYLLAGPPDGLAVAALVAGQPVGLLNLAPAEVEPGAGRQFELGIMVADSWQRRGIGTALLDYALDRHARPGWTVRATVQPDNLAALALLWGRRGVRLVSDAPGEYSYELAKAG